MEDWLDVLEPMPQFAVEAACAAYLRDESYPPRPADIYQRAAAVMGDLRKRIEEVSAPREAPAIVIDEETRKRRAAVLSDLAAELRSKNQDAFGRKA